VLDYIRNNTLDAWWIGSVISYICVHRRDNGIWLRKAAEAHTVHSIQSSKYMPLEQSMQWRDSCI